MPAMGGIAYQSPFNLTSGTPQPTKKAPPLTPEQLQELEFKQAHGKLDISLADQAASAAATRAPSQQWTPPASAVRPSVQALAPSGRTSPSGPLAPPPNPTPTIGTNVIPPPGLSAAEEAAERADVARYAREDLLERDRLNREGEDRRFGRFKEVADMPIGGPGGSTGPSGPAGPAYDENAARAAAFGRAKDTAGKNARASLTALREVMAERGGALGSNYEAAGTGAVLGESGGDVNDFIREQYIQDLNRAAGVADREAGANVTRRGQDMGYRQSLLALLNNGGGLY